MSYTSTLRSFSLALVAAGALAACGGNNSGAGTDAAVANCTIVGMSCTADGDCCTGTCDPDLKVCSQPAGSCLATGDACHVGYECCSFSCVNAQCSDTQCVSDGDQCDSDGQCCGGSCVNNSCAPLNDACKTSGNSCNDNVDCCSGYCNNNVCDANPSFCRQSGDICASDTECCGGLCSKADGAAVGTCAKVPASGATQCLGAGEVCGGTYDGGNLPICGGECCSRACLPYGPTGIMICQPPSGCRPTGEVCAEDSDCCGAMGNPDGTVSDIHCSKEGNNPLGRCDNGNACTPAGGICRLQTDSCNANANCCSGNVLQKDTCKLDNLGIPRCLAAEIDCTDPSVYVGQDCATSADCCGLPCTPSTSGEFPTLTCGGDACVASGGACTNNADCCSALPCVIPPGSTQGTCGDNPGSCAEYGQQCTATSDCCSGLACDTTTGTCGAVVN